METVKLVRSGADTQYKRANKQVSRQKHKLFLCDFSCWHTPVFLRTQPIYCIASYSLLRLMLMHAIKLVPSSKHCLICSKTTVGRNNKQLTTTEIAYITQLCVWDVFNHNQNMFLQGNICDQATSWYYRCRVGSLIRYGPVCCTAM